MAERKVQMGISIKDAEDRPGREPTKANAPMPSLRSLSDELLEIAERCSRSKLRDGDASSGVEYDGHGLP
ncbi:MAG: hypothetical protein P4L83_08190 [Nevskia sp.]|nr:hypothetical protein [Nevskia sp.]